MKQAPPVAEYSDHKQLSIMENTHIPSNVVDVQ